MKVLLTGGTGYIGSHTAVELLLQGFEVVLVDNFSNSKPGLLPRLEKLTGRVASFYEADLLNLAALEAIFKTERVDAVIHLAGLKSVAESTADPLRYYDVNLSTSINLCHAALAANVRQIVFSSSATVYGSNPASIPIAEASPVVDATSPYGRSKIFIERILQDLAAVNPGLRVALLRYFNPAGAHESGEIGEDPGNLPGNLIPFLTQVAIGKKPELVIFGDDYQTPDGTCIRDYIHIKDLALGHIAVLEKQTTSVVTYNLGTGNGHSVHEVVAAFERATGQHIPRRIGPRREGDSPTSITDPSLALTDLNWQAEKTLPDICQDAWRWQQQNPNGYEG